MTYFSELAPPANTDGSEATLAARSKRVEFEAKPPLVCAALSPYLSNSTFSAVTVQSWSSSADYRASQLLLSTADQEDRQPLSISPG